MFPSWRLALNNLAGRRLRTGLMLAAVALASSLVVAVSTAIHSAQSTFETWIHQFLGETDARVIHQFNGRFDADLLDTIRQWPEVELATGRLDGTLTLVRADGRVDPDTDRPMRTTANAVGVDLQRELDFRRLELDAGRLPRDPGEMLIDPLAADALEAEVGDVLHVQRFGEPVAFEVAGVYERRRLGTLQRPRVYVDADVLGELGGRSGQLTSVAILVRDGVDVRAFTERYNNDLPRVLTLEPAELAKSGFDRRVHASRLGLVIASILAFMSAAFIIVTGLTTAVNERQREMAILRCIGATRSQLFASQLFVGGLLGGLGAVIGVPVGIGLAAALLSWLTNTAEVDLYVSTLGVYLTLIGSLAAGLLGAAYPAWLAGRVTPMRALTSRARPARLTSIALCGAAGLALLGAQAALLLPDDGEQRFWLHAFAGLPLLHIAYFLLAVPALWIVTHLLAGPPLDGISRLLRLPAGMLARSVLATPFRHGFTAGALMVGISVMVSTWSNGTALTQGWLDRMQFADGFAFRTTGIPPDEQRAIANLDFVTDHCPISYMPLRVIGQQVFGVEGVSPPNVVGVGFDPETFFRMNTIDWLQGDPEHAIPRLNEGNAVIVAEHFLIARGIGVGDTLTLGRGRVEIEFEIVGVVESAGLDIATQLFGVRSAYMEQAVSTVFLDFNAVAEHFDNREAVLMQLNIAGDVTDDEADEALKAVAPGVTFRSGRWIVEAMEWITGAVLTIYSTVAMAALVLACFGVSNIIMANIRSRSFEYGVLRAVGAHRGVLLRLILGEAALLAITAGLVGAALGLHLAAVNTVFLRDLAGVSINVAFPAWPIVIGWTVLLVMTLAAAAPAAIALMRQPALVLLTRGRSE